MLAGILFQLATTTIFVVLAVDFMVRVTLDKPYPAKWRNMCVRRKKRNTVQSSAAASDSLATVTEPTSEKAISRLDGKWLRKSQLLLLGVAWATLMIYIRGIYRSIELAEGWDGRVITTEVSHGIRITTDEQSYFVWLDAFMMVLLMAGLAIAHPGWLLPPTGWK